MIALPLVFLLIWFIREYKKHKICPASYMVLLYLVTAICSILIDVNNFYTDSCMKMPLGIVAPFLYCFLLFICILPYTKLKLPTFHKIGELHGLNTIVIFYWVIFLITFFVSYNKLSNIFVEQDFVAVRNAQYSGDAESFYNHLTGLPRYASAICSVLSPSSFILIFVFFYSITCLSKKWWYNLLILIPSFTPLLISMNVADRSMFAYWVILFGFSASFFVKEMTRKTKIGMGIAALFIISILLVYFIAVSIARFEMRDSGTGGGIIAYAGENYINFCNWINYTEPGFIFDRIMPVTGHYLVQINPIMPKAVAGAAPGYELDGFGTFLGGLYQSGGFIVMTMYCIIYFFISSKFIRDFSLRKYYSFNSLFVLWGLGLVVVLGLFGHFYSTENCVFAFIGWILWGKFLQSKNKKEIRWSLDNNSNIIM